MAAKKPAVLPTSESSRVSEMKQLLMDRLQNNIARPGPPGPQVCKFTSVRIKIGSHDDSDSKRLRLVTRICAHLHFWNGIQGTFEKTRPAEPSPCHGPRPGIILNSSCDSTAASDQVIRRILRHHTLLSNCRRAIVKFSVPQKFHKLACTPPYINSLPVPPGPALVLKFSSIPQTWVKLMGVPSGPHSFRILICAERHRDICAGLPLPKNQIHDEQNPPLA